MRRERKKKERRKERKKEREIEREDGDIKKYRGTEKEKNEQRYQ